MFRLLRRKGSAVCLMVPLIDCIYHLGWNVKCFLSACLQVGEIVAVVHHRICADDNCASLLGKAILFRRGDI